MAGVSDYAPSVLDSAPFPHLDYAVLVHGYNPNSPDFVL
jgi:hypothetical protein